MKEIKGGIKLKNFAFKYFNLFYFIFLDLKQILMKKILLINKLANRFLSHKFAESRKFLYPKLY